MRAPLRTADGRRRRPLTNAARYRQAASPPLPPPTSTRRADTWSAPPAAAAGCTRGIAAHDEQRVHAADARCRADRRAPHRRLPRACSSATRSPARCRSSSISPNRIDSVGHAVAHAGCMPALLPVVAERALERAAIVRPPVDDAERTADDAVAAAVADVGLDVDAAELGADDRAGRARLETAGVLAVLADVGRELPRDAARPSCRRRRTRSSISTNFTWRQVEWPRAVVLSYDSPLHAKPSPGTSFHSLHATSHALQPMHSVESVRNAVVGIRTAAPAHDADARYDEAQRGRAAAAPADVAHEAFRFHDPDVRLFGDRDEIVGRVAGDEPACPSDTAGRPGARAAVHRQRRHARGDQRARFDHAARRRDRDPAAVRAPTSRRQLRRDLGEELRLQLGEMRERAAHAAGRVMLGQPIRRQHVRETRIAERRVRIVGALLLVGRRIALPIRIERVRDGDSSGS